MCQSFFGGRQYTVAKLFPSKSDSDTFSSLDFSGNPGQTKRATFFGIKCGGVAADAGPRFPYLSKYLTFHFQ